jgi:saccharopine dehydrogenase (NAD+, L-lysine forming)
MGKLKVGIIREGKIPTDRRVPLTPKQAKEVEEKFNDVKVYCQSSLIRCYKDFEYQEEGIEVVSDIHHCDILLGIKEVPVHELIPGKTYMFFSHTIKKQPYNRNLLREIIRNKIHLIDYEVLTNKAGQRLIAFGRYAGIVGAYNGILTYGNRYKLFTLRRARDCYDMEDLKTEYSRAKLPPVKIALTGGGRVASGAMEVLEGMGVTKVSVDDYLKHSFDFPVYAQLRSKDYNKRKGSGEFNSSEFYENPENYESDFLKFSKVTDLLIAAAYWDPNAPNLFQREDVLKEEFKIRVIADITCDIEGSIPCTKIPSTIDDPVYDYSAYEDKVLKPYSGGRNISVMAVDNLPCELPRNASEDFGFEMVNSILPNLLGTHDVDDIIQRATITENGRLNDRYKYLEDYISERENT